MSSMNRRPAQATSAKIWTAAAHADLPFVVELEEGKSEQPGEQEDVDGPRQAQEVEPPDRTGQRLLLGIVQPGAEPGEPVSHEAHMDSMGGAPTERIAAVAVADQQVGAPGELLAPDLGPLIVREIDPLAGQEGGRPVRRFALVDGRDLHLGSRRMRRPKTSPEGET